ncbi:MAG: hypothetical protein MI922_00850, partial [Bacteroidales bacterium]|nr:hypothetical protein [Bacteroidales bacterium]
GSKNVNLLGWSGAGTDNGGQGWYDLTIAVNPSNSNEVFVGGVNIWKSTTGGSSWEINSHWTHSGQAEYVHADQHMLAFNPINNILYSANDGGLYKSSTLNQDWVSISNGLEITQFYKFGLSNSSTPSIVGGSQDNGTFLKSDDWSTILGGDGMECFFDYTNPDVIYGSLYYGSIRRSDNGGYSFKSIKPINASDGMWITPYIIHPDNPNKILAGYEKVYYSTNKGDSWVALNDNFELHYPKDALFTELAYAPSNPNIIYAAMSRNVFITQNHGESWTNITAGLPNSRISSITVEKDNPLSVWITFSNFNNGKKVYHSADGGENWTNISNGLPNIPVNDIVCRPNSLQELYVGTDIGVYHRSSQSDIWELFGDSLPSVIVSELEFDVENQNLWAATYGRGVWNCELPEVLLGIDFTCLSTSICVNSELDLVYTGDPVYDSLVWIINNESFKTLGDTLKYSPTAVGFYDVELKHYKNGIVKNKVKPNYFEATQDIEFEVYPTFTEIIGCPGSPVLIQATGNYQYNWSSSVGTTATNTNTFEVQINQDQEITVEANQGNCYASRTATVNFQADNIADAKYVSPGVYGPYFNDCATVENNEPVPPGISCMSQNSWCPGENTLENSLWFYTIAPRSGSLTIEATGMNTQLAVYRAKSATDILNGTYDLLGANDNDQTYNDGSAVVYLGNNLMPKDKLWIQVDGGASGETGSFELVLQDLYNITTLNGTTISALNMEVNPVPASERVNYKVYVPELGLLTVTLYDIRGTVMHQAQVDVNQPVHEGYFINRNKLSGVYYLVATTKASRVLKKVVFD